MSHTETGCGHHLAELFVKLCSKPLKKKIFFFCVLELSTNFKRKKKKNPATLKG